MCVQTQKPLGPLIGIFYRHLVTRGDSLITALISRRLGSNLRERVQDTFEWVGQYHSQKMGSRGDDGHLGTGGYSGGQPAPRFSEAERNIRSQIERKMLHLYSKRMMEPSL